MTDLDRDALVSTEWLAERLGDPALRVVDATWYLPNVGRSGRADYEAAHIPGALYWDIDAIADPADALPHMVPAPEDFARMVGALGIGSAHDIVVYDALGLFTAPRVWWMLRLFGHRAVAVLDGGLKKWAAEGRPTESGTVRLPPARFELGPPAAAVLSLEEMKGTLSAGDRLVLDARSAGRFAGAEPEPRPGCRAGHIPGSRNLPFTELVDAVSGTLLPPEALARRFAAAGVAAGRPVATSCGSGVTACVLALGLHRIGHAPVAVYDGSWSEWGTRGDTPVATGPDAPPTDAAD